MLTKSRRPPPGEAADRTAELVEGLAALLAAGVPAAAAWEYLSALTPHPFARRVVASTRQGASTAQAVVAASTGPTADPSHPVLGAVWWVADAAGAPLAPALGELAAALRDNAETEREVQQALAGPRATGALVSWLPAAGFVLAFLLGVDPVGALTGSPVGWGLAVVGFGLIGLGRLWTSALVRRAAPPAVFAGISEELISVGLSAGLSVGGAEELARSGVSRFGLAVRENAAEQILRLADAAGAPPADLLRSSGRQARAQERTDGRRRASRLAVWLMLPLGICVLPSFMLLGVAPVVLAIVSSTVGSF